MERTIWKAVLRPTEVQEIEVPAGAELLCAREQRGQICVWYRCDPDPRITKVKRAIALVGTGHAAPPKGRYLGTASLRAGDLMFHVFERT